MLLPFSVTKFSDINYTVITSLLYNVLGTQRKVHSLDGGDGIVRCIMRYLNTNSKLDVDFCRTPVITLEDWRLAQLAMERDNIMLYAMVASVKIYREGNIERDVFVIPSTALVNEAKKSSSPAAIIRKKQSLFLKIYKKGLSALGNEDEVIDLGFDEVMGVLDSCIVLHELVEPEVEIKYQCSCFKFWHYYKCRHALAMSIMKKDVEIPARYSASNVGSTRKRGRPRDAHRGEALGANTKRPKKQKI